MDRHGTDNTSPDSDRSPERNTPPAPVTLVKGAHRWTFACGHGDERELLDRVSQLARDESAPFDWFDAALVSHQLGRRLRAGLHRVDTGHVGSNGHGSAGSEG